LVAALPLAGCVDPNLYTTPRTLNPGKVQLLRVTVDRVGALDENFAQLTAGRGLRGSKMS
jgi:hypothetical protein